MHLLEQYIFSLYYIKSKIQENNIAYIIQEQRKSQL